MTRLVVDTSALVAIILDEADGPTFRDALVAADTASMSAATYVECGVVLDRRLNVAAGILDRYLARAGIDIVALGAEQAAIARWAYRNYGRGSGHPARLNFGDCFSYALAIDRNEPLLYKGDDFSHTDVRTALTSG